MKPLFSETQPEIEKKEERYMYLGNVPTSSDLKFHKVLTTDKGEPSEKQIFHEVPFFLDAALIARTHAKTFHKQYNHEVS